MSFENFKVGEIVKGRVCGTFRVIEFGNCLGMNSVRLKEVHPEDYTRESPSPKLVMPFDSIRKI